MDDNRSVKLIEDTRADRVLAQTLALAFQDDPAMVWIIPDPVTRKMALPKLFKIMIQSDRRSGWVVGSPMGEAVTLWRAPGKIEVTLSEMILAAGPLIAAMGPGFLRALTISDAIEKYHPKGDDFWYLHVAGVCPVHQGKGWGGIAIRDGLARASAQGKSVLLETATPANVPLYRRLGFVVTQEWNAPRGGPHFWTMWREKDS